MARSSAQHRQKDRSPGDQIRVNLSGDVADDVVKACTELGISYSAYVQLRLLGRLTPDTTPAGPEQTVPVQPNPTKAATGYSTPTETVLTLSDLPKP